MFSLVVATIWWLAVFAVAIVAVIHWSEVISPNRVPITRCLVMLLAQFVSYSISMAVASYLGMYQSQRFTEYTVTLEVLFWLAFLVSTFSKRTTEISNTITNY